MIKKANNAAGKSAMMAFGAAAASGLLATNELEADIVYSGTLNSTIGAGSSLAFDFDGDTVDDVQVSVTSSFDADGLNGAGIWGDPVLGSAYANNFAYGDLIQGAATTTGNGWMGWYNGGISSDPWGALQAGVNGTGPVTGFMGFTFNGNQGWMQLSLQADALGRPETMTVIDWAYEDSGAPIAAGDIGAVPEPGAAGLLLMAMGAVGLRRKRRAI